VGVTVGLPSGSAGTNGPCWPQALSNSNSMIKDVRRGLNSATECSEKPVVYQARATLRPLSADCCHQRMVWASGMS